jgi:ABC-type nitrate/sulfonate/bicarbonate transport system substrate-binding protein
MSRIPKSPRKLAHRVVPGLILLMLAALPILTGPGCGNAPSKLVVGALAGIDTLPLTVARQKPIFAENDLVVNSRVYQVPADLSSAVLAGEVDAIVTDLFQALLLNQDIERGKIVRVALRGPAACPAGDFPPTLRLTVVVFREKFVRETPAVIRRFLRAYEQSVREINTRPQSYHSMAAGMVRASPGTVSHLTIPVYPFPGEVPTESEIEAANAWLVAKHLLKDPVMYTRAVHPGFLWDPYQFKPAACCGW